MLSKIHRRWGQALALLAIAMPDISRAAIDNSGVLDNVLAPLHSATTHWGQVMVTHATFLFWVLATISMVWTMGMMILRQADLGEFFAEFIRFIVFTGFFWWLLVNGPAMATALIQSLRQIGGEAGGAGPALSPSGIVDIGFDLLFRVLDQSTVWTPLDSAIGFVLALMILLFTGLIGIAVLLQLIGAWALAYAGVFLLGFGGARWTSDLAVDYFKAVLSHAVQMMLTILLIGVGRSYIDGYYTAMSGGLSLKELSVMLIVSLALLGLIYRVPLMVGRIALGRSLTTTGARLSQGAWAMGSAAMAGAGAAVAAAASAAATATTGNGSSLVRAVQSAARTTTPVTSEMPRAEPNFSSHEPPAGTDARSPRRVDEGSTPLASAMGDSGTTGSRPNPERTERDSPEPVNEKPPDAKS